MQMSSSRFADAQIVLVEEERIDAAASIAFKDRMRQLTEDGPETVILDLNRVQFIDSSGLGAIVSAMKQLGQGRRLHLAGLMPNVASVFQLTRMDTVIPIHESAEMAVKHHAG